MTPDVLGILRSNKTPRAELAYVDDSGDPGWQGSKTVGLGCVLVPMDAWTDRLDLMVLMRREIRDRYGVRMTDEIKGEWLAGAKKQFRILGLGDGQLRDIYRRHLRMTSLIASRTFAVVFVKSEFTSQTEDLESRRWEFLLQRLRKRSEQTGAPIVLVHDHGSTDMAIRRHLRKFRRFSYAPGGRPVESPLLIEDPVPRDSAHSYFVQLADLVAYAGSRRVVHAQGYAAKICGPQMWDEIGTSKATEVSWANDDGIVRWSK